MARLKDVDWSMTPLVNGNYQTSDCQLAVLMDIRDELKKLNLLLHCPNVRQIPQILREIRANTTKRRRKPKTS